MRCGRRKGTDIRARNGDSHVARVDTCVLFPDRLHHEYIYRGTPDDVERLRNALDMPSQMPPPLDEDLRTPIPTGPRSGARRDSDIVAPGFPRVSLGGLSDGLRPSSLPSLPSGGGGGGTGGSGSFRLHETFTQSLDPVTGSALMRTLDAKAHAVLALIVEQLSASNTDEMCLSSIARGLGRNHAARLFHSVLALSQAAKIHPQQSGNDVTITLAAATEAVY